MGLSPFEACRRWAGWAREPHVARRAQGRLRPANRDDRSRRAGPAACSQAASPALLGARWDRSGRACACYRLATWGLEIRNADLQTVRLGGTLAAPFVDRQFTSAISANA